MTPRVSIVMPVRDRAALTLRSVRAILAEPPATSWELIVVDDGSRDDPPAALAALGDAVRVVRRAESGGFAAACNDGAAAARGRDALVFLNNDTVPRRGWLDALVDASARHPRAAVVGSLLLFADGSVQHAGVVFGQDGYPRHLYAGLPRDHPAVVHERRLQAVTAACALVRRDAFESAGGFDGAYVNGLEDVDLCLRLGEAGWEVRYCPDSVVVHFESATRGRHGGDRRDGERRYRERWRDVVRRDDLERYAEDGLLRVRYADAHPYEIEVSPVLAVASHAGGDDALVALLRAFSRRAAELLGDVAALTAQSAGHATSASRVPANGDAAVGAVPTAAALHRLDGLQAELAQLQAQLGCDGGATAYRAMIGGVRAAVEASVPAGATCLVISRGDDDLVDQHDRRVLHFPQDSEGGYAGHHPADSGEAIERLERLRASGAEYLVIPASAAWWLEHYRAFADHLAGYEIVLDGPDCRIVSLEAVRA